MELNKEIEKNISEVLIEKPVGFRLGRVQFYIYPLTLGKMQILKSLYLSIDVNKELLAVNPLAETLRVCRAEPLKVCQVIAYATFPDKESLLEEKKVFRRARYFRKKLPVSSQAILLSLILSSDKMEEFIQYFGIDEDRDIKTKVSQIKGESHSITFGGKSIYGLLIDFACQRYGWTMDYVLWGISYINLNMLFADAITTVYLSDEERRKLGKGVGITVNADDPANRELLRRMISE